MRSCLAIVQDMDAVEVMDPQYLRKRVDGPIYVALDDTFDLAERTLKSAQQTIAR